MKRIILKSSILILSAATLLLGACDGIIDMNRQLPSGTPIWAKSAVGGTADSNFNHVAAGPDGIYTVGYLGPGTLDLGNGVTATGLSSCNFVVVKFHENGNPLWAKAPFAAGGRTLLGTIALSSDAVYVAGTISGGNYDFGDSVLLNGLPTGIDSGLLLKYDFSGKCIWAKIVSGPNRISFTDIKIIDNFLYGVGSCSDPGTYDFGNSVQASGTARDNPFIVQYNLSGEAQWAKTMVSGSGEYLSVAVDDDGIYTCGTAFGAGTIDFGYGISTTTGFSNYNPLLVKYSLAGIPVWAFSTAKDKCEGARFHDLSINESSIFVAGSIVGSGSIRLGAIPVYTANGNNCVIAGFSKSGTPQWARSITSGFSDTAYYGLSSSDNRIFVCGEVFGYSTINFGNRVLLDTYCANNPVLVEYSIDGTAQMAKSIIPPASASGSAFFNSIVSYDNSYYTIGSIGNGDYHFGNDTSIFVSSTVTFPLIVEYSN